METPEFWDKTWDKRIKDDGIRHNIPKFNRLIKKLWEKYKFAPMEKLDIGCGPATHAILLAQYNPFWKDRWTGIDLSRRALSVPRSLGFNASHGSIFDFQSDKKFELFLFLDSLEHMQDHVALGKKIKELADDKYVVFGNVPLYLSDSGEERVINVSIVGDFLKSAGCFVDFSCEVYGVKGYPYANFEATNK